MKRLYEQIIGLIRTVLALTALLGSLSFLAWVTQSAPTGGCQDIAY